MAFVSCLSLPPHPTRLPLSLFSLSASRLSYSFSAGKVKCCLLPVRSEGAQGYSSPLHPTPPTPPPRFVATMLLAASSPAPQPASGGSNGSRPGCRGMCLSPVVSSLLSSSQLLQVDLFSTRRTQEKRGPPRSCRRAAGISSQCLWSREMISNEDERETETERKRRDRHQRKSADLHLVQVGVLFHSVFFFYSGLIMLQ